MTTEMVEKVARALHAHEWKGQPNPEPFHVGREYWQDAARAAIRALKEPTEDMVDAALQSGPGRKMIWQAMLTAALGEDR